VTLVTLGEKASGISSIPSTMTIPTGYAHSQAKCSPASVRLSVLTADVNRVYWRVVANVDTEAALARRRSARMSSLHRAGHQTAGN